MSMLDREESVSPPKKQKLGNDNACKGGGLVQNNCTFINISSVIVGSVGDALKIAGVVKEVEEDGKCLKEEELLSFNLFNNCVNMHFMFSQIDLCRWLIN